MKRSFKFFVAFLLVTIIAVSACACNALSGGTADNGNGDSEYSAPASDGNSDSASEYGGNSADGGSTEQRTTVNLMDGVTKGTVSATTPDVTFTNAYNAFTANLFKALYEGKNEFISPASIELALSMTANGARNKTLTEMQNVLYGGANVATFNAYFKAYVEAITSLEDIKINVANSIWFKDDGNFSVEQAFLQTNADYYGAAAYKSPFDAKTLADINNWAKEKTDGMIEKVLDEISKDAVMYLINAILFDAKWTEAFESSYDGNFTKEGGATTQVKYMHGDNMGYYYSDLAEGFSKPYGNGRFSFLAMLPKENVSMGTLVNSLSGTTLTSYFNSKLREKVVFKMPKFKLDYEAQLNDALVSLGMNDAFAPFDADFKALGTYRGENIYISFVKHKTAIEVTEAGTKAAAVTVVGMEKTTSVGPEGKVHYIYLDRPFVYFIMDNVTNTPLFMGVYNG